jgi:amidohydrolase
MIKHSFSLDTIPNLIEVRKYLHAHPEVSNQETETSAFIKSLLLELHPTEIITGLGVHGVAAVFKAPKPGPTIVFRCELDGLPIEEVNSFEYRSLSKGVSHKCGHDGHMTILLGLCHRVVSNKNRTGTFVALFQPAEETGDGAKLVVNDSRFQQLNPDFIFAIHNYPGLPLGTLEVRSGTMTCGSCGVKIQLKGQSSHAAYPHEARSPQKALCELLEKLQLIPSSFSSELINLVSITHAQLGVPSFGIVPGDATIQLTARSESQQNLDRILEMISKIVEDVAMKDSLEFVIDYSDYFPVGTNDKQSVELFLDAASSADLSASLRSDAVRWSEDFAYFTQNYKGALAVIGSGENCFPLHSAHYDFPDDLIPIAIDLLYNLFLKAEAS